MVRAVREKRVNSAELRKHPREPIGTSVRKLPEVVQGRCNESIPQIKFDDSLTFGAIIQAYKLQF